MTKHQPPIGIRLIGSLSDKLRGKLFEKTQAEKIQELQDKIKLAKLEAEYRKVLK